MSGLHVVCLWTLWLVSNALIHALTSGMQSAFDVIHTPVMQCNDSCARLVPEEFLFLETAPCPPVWNLSLICQHSSRLDCDEVAAILDRCISQYDVDCDTVFSALDACVCDFNLTCSSLNDTYFNNCGWKNRDYSCRRPPTTLVVPSSGVPGGNTTPSAVENSTSLSDAGDKTVDGVQPVTTEATTPLIGGSVTPPGLSCDSTCIVVAVLGPAVLMVTLIVLYRCYIRYNKRTGKTGPVPMTKVNSIDSTTKETKFITSNGIHPGEKKQLKIPPVEKPFGSNIKASLKVGRPCSNFCTGMFNTTDTDTIPYYNSRTLPVGSAWDSVTMSGTETMTFRIPRPSLVTTFQYKPEEPQMFDTLVGYTNPVYEETI
ncbi:uncharacterized protein LOC135469079 [Liolophura sinensis]|uniref:uncharacterized protein LOC135469079 n=1 Tax=Liolophura sinensis TaxID=3198878 RepID=UPI0031585D99